MIIDFQRCKGCALCVSACKKNLLAIDKQILNTKGYSPVVLTNKEECTNCTMCAVMCPDSAISCK